MFYIVILNILNNWSFLEIFLEIALKKNRNLFNVIKTHVLFSTLILTSDKK